MKTTLGALRASALTALTLLSLAAPFDNRPGRLYSFVAHKGAT